MLEVFILHFFVCANIYSQSTFWVRVPDELDCKYSAELRHGCQLLGTCSYSLNISEAFGPSLYGIRCCVRNFLFGKHYFLLISKERNILAKNIRCDYMKTSLIWVRFDFHQRFLHVVQCIRHQLSRKKNMFISMYLGAFIWLINRKVMKHFLRWTRKTIVRLSLFKFASKWDSVDL